LLPAFSICTRCNQPASVAPVSNPGTSSALSKNIELKLGFSNWPGWIPWYVSETANLFKFDKAKMTPVWYDDYSQGLIGLVIGQVEANSQTLIDTVLSVGTGSDQVVVLVNDNSTGNDKIIAKAGINTMSDLKGKVISTEKGTVDHYLILLAMKKAGLTPKDVTFKFMDTQKAAEAFAAGQVDATAVFAPFTNTALKKAGSKELASSKDFPGAISDVLAFRRSFVESNPEVVQATVNTWFETLDYIKSHQAQANEIMAKKANVSVAEYAEFDKGIKIFSPADNIKAFQAGTDQTSLAFSAEALKKGVIELGITKNSPDLSKLFDDRFIKAYAASHKSS
jgi:NitT/TauT family transport system substrate-binding protein